MNYKIHIYLNNKEYVSNSYYDPNVFKDSHGIEKEPKDIVEVADKYLDYFFGSRTTAFRINIKEINDNGNKRVFYNAIPMLFPSVNLNSSTIYFTEV